MGVIVCMIHGEQIVRLLWACGLILLVTAIAHEAATYAVKTRFFDESTMTYFMGWRGSVAGMIQTRLVSYPEVKRFIASHLLTVLYCQASNTEAFDDIDEVARAEVIELVLCKRVIECWNLHYRDSFKWRLLGLLFNMP